MEQLLATKLFIPPLRPDLVPRPALFQHLDEGLARKLTLVSAPAGFGKSTLVADWIFTRNQPAGWLSLDQGDSDPVRFWTYFIAAVQTIHADIGVEARQIVSVPQLRSTKPVAVSLINDISQLTRQLVVVLDDFHLIEGEQVQVDLEFLLENQPPNLHIVLITRIDPPISLARLRAHNQLIEVRARDLQFSLEDASTLLNDRMGLDLESAQIEALTEHTENWVVGLQLAALSLKGRISYDTFITEFTGTHQFILDYLIEEVIDILPEGQRGFLLRTSILNRFSADLCQAVTGDPSSRNMLDEIRRNNLFLIPLDSRGSWFRYHHLFSEVLYALLEKDHPDEMTSLHLKAAEWFGNEGYSSEAVDHALSSGDMIYARKQVLAHWMPVLHRGELATLLRWFDALPESVDESDPSIPLVRCWALFLSWRINDIEPHLEQALQTYKKLVDDGSLTGSNKDLVAAQLAMIRSVLARGNGQHSRSVAYAEEAAQLIPPEITEIVGTHWNMLAAAYAGAGDFDGAIKAFEQGIALSYTEGNLVGAYGCIYGQSMYLLIQGRLNEAAEFCLQAIDKANREGNRDFPAAGSLYITMSRISLEKNSLEEARAYLETGLRIAQPGGFSEAVRAGRYIQAYLFALEGDFDRAFNAMQDIERIINAFDDSYLTGELNFEWTKIHLLAGDLESANKKLHILEEMGVKTQHANLLLWQGWLQPRLLYSGKQYPQALKTVDRSIQRARGMNSSGELIHLLALKAVVLDAMGSHADAVHSALHEALLLGASGGYIRRWLDAGPGITSLLQDLESNPSTPQSALPYLVSLLEACRDVFGKSPIHQQGQLPEALTARELEILILINKGYSNPQIALELVITLNTVKKHTSNIYAKLGVQSRTQAILRARELNLL